MNNQPDSTNLSERGMDLTEGEGSTHPIETPLLGAMGLPPGVTDRKRSQDIRNAPPPTGSEETPHFGTPQYSSTPNAQNDYEAEYANMKRDRGVPDQQAPTLGSSLRGLNQTLQHIMRQVADIDNRQHEMTREFAGVREVLGVVRDNQTRLEQRVPVHAHNAQNGGVNNTNRVPSPVRQGVANDMPANVQQGGQHGFHPVNNGGINQAQGGQPAHNGGPAYGQQGGPPVHQQVPNQLQGGPPNRNPPRLQRNVQGLENTLTEAHYFSKIGKFQTYGGEPNENFNTFMKQLVRKLRTLQVPHEMHLDYLIDNLVGKAADFVFNLPDLDRYDFLELATKVDSRFSKVEDPSLMMNKLSVCVQGPDQSVEAYAEEIRILAQKALPAAQEQVIESLCVSRFFQGVHNKGAALSAHSKLPASLERAVLEYNRALVQQQIILGSSSVRRLSSIDREQGRRDKDDREHERSHQSRRDYADTRRGYPSNDRSPTNKDNFRGERRDSRSPNRKYFGSGYQGERRYSRSPDRRDYNGRSSPRRGYEYNRDSRPSPRRDYAYRRESRSPNRFGDRQRRDSRSPSYGRDRRSISPYKYTRDDRFIDFCKRLYNLTMDSPKRPSQQGCFECGAMDHFKVDCPSLQSAHGKSVTFKDSNEGGAA